MVLQLYCCCCDCVSGPDGCSSYLCCCKVGSGHTGFEKGGGDLATCAQLDDMRRCFLTSAIAAQLRALGCFARRSFGIKRSHACHQLPVQRNLYTLPVTTTHWVCFVQEHRAGVQLLRCASSLPAQAPSYCWLCVWRVLHRSAATSQAVPSSKCRAREGCEVCVCGARRAFAAKCNAQHPATAAACCRQLRLRCAAAALEATQCNITQLLQASQRQCSLRWSCSCSLYECAVTGCMGLRDTERGSRARRRTSAEASSPLLSNACPSVSAAASEMAPC